jgi:hypothetical protein
MKKVLMVLGIVFLVLLFALAAFIGYVAYNGNRLDASSKLFVDQSVPAILSSWSRDEMVKRSSPQLREKSSDDQIDRLFAMLSSKLGPFQSYDGAKGDSRMNYDLGKRELTTTAFYVANATFQRGKAEIKVHLVRDRGRWEILGFNVQARPL